MANSGLCYVKYTFPPEVDISGLDLNQIEGKGLFIDRSGSFKTFDSRFLVNKFNAVERWIVLQGCEFDPVGKSENQLTNFVQDYFEVTFKGLKNPPTN